MKIGGEIPDQVKENIVRVLKNHLDTFATQASEIVGIDSIVVAHSLNTDPSIKPVKQKKWNFATERQKIIASETAKLLEAGFVREVRHPEWLANVVLVQKPNGKYRMCVDYIDLNKACPKDSYPLPIIDRLVDSTACHKMYNFVDVTQGYHQTPIKREDQEKTSFTTHQGLYCYNIMPFGLKNVGATYQRFRNFFFKEDIGKTTEVYVRSNRQKPNWLGPFYRFGASPRKTWRI